MNKTIAEILTPKPEARPRIYAYSIDDKEHAKAPTARPKLSPGHRPGFPGSNDVRPEGPRYTARYPGGPFMSEEILGALTLN